MRNTVDITIDAEGRDKGKKFRLTEMPASQGEDWAMRAFFGLAASGVDIPNLEEVRHMGLAGIATIGLKALGGLTPDIARPLMAEMWDCVQIVSSAGVVRKPTEDDIDEIATRIRLRKEVFELHTGFFSFLAQQASAKSTAKESQSGTPNTSTSPDQSQP